MVIRLLTPKQSTGKALAVHFQELTEKENWFFDDSLKGPPLDEPRGAAWVRLPKLFWMNWSLGGAPDSKNTVRKVRVKNYIKTYGI